MKIIDAHMHFFRYAGFDQVARAAGHENTVENYLQACRENNVVLSVAMGNAPLGPSRFGGVVPRVPDLAGPAAPWSPTTSRRRLPSAPDWKAMA